MAKRPHPLAEHPLDAAETAVDFEFRRLAECDHEFRAVLVFLHDAAHFKAYKADWKKWRGYPYDGPAPMKYAGGLWLHHDGGDVDGIAETAMHVGARFEIAGPRERNPLSPFAHACESAPCALARPVGGLPLDDRAGVHVTDDWGLALRYAAFKASRSASVAVVLTYDMAGLKLESDFDAKVDQEHTALESAWFLKEFDILYDPEHPDYDRLAGVLENDGDGDSDDEGPPWSVEHELIKQSKTPIRLVIAEHLREGGAEAARALAAVAEDKAPLDYHAEAIHQWRTFSEVGDDRLVKVEVVRPFNDEVSDEDVDDSDACPATFTLDDLSGIADAMETKTLYARRGARGAAVYYHGTDLTRAQEILSGTGIELVNPWAPCVQPGD